MPPSPLDEVGGDRAQKKSPRTTATIQGRNIPAVLFALPTTKTSLTAFVRFATGVVKHEAP